MAEARREEYSMNREVAFKYYGNLIRIADDKDVMSNWHENLELQLCIKGKFILLSIPHHACNILSKAVIG